MIIIPPLTLEACKSTVLNCFLFRQTDLIPRGTIRERTAPLDLNQQRSTGKMKTLSSFRFGHETTRDNS